jgi:hypothetical protein
MRNKNGMNYLRFVQHLEEWRVYSSGRNRLALYHCNYDGPDCQGQCKQVPSDVRNNKVVSCGCYKKLCCKTHPRRRADYAGKTIGRFQVLHLVGTRGDADHPLSLWKATCLDCGKEVELTSTDIRRNVSSCRCLFDRTQQRKGWDRRVRHRLRNEELTTFLKEKAHASSS